MIELNPMPSISYGAYLIKRAKQTSGYTANKDLRLLRAVFNYGTRYFADSGIIGSKEFVAENYQRFKHLFHSKHEKIPKPIKVLEGMYPLKRLSEVF